uniref:Uncharacterized protein n=1 Tax=Ditylenchus dipsaci TaxID=166011 RepID=A0A915ENJ8_9BILA
MTCPRLPPAYSQRLSVIASLIARRQFPFGRSARSFTKAGGCRSSQCILHVEALRATRASAIIFLLGDPFPPVHTQHDGDGRWCTSHLHPSTELTLGEDRLAICIHQNLMIIAEFLAHFLLADDASIERSIDWLHILSSFFNERSDWA